MRRKWLEIGINLLFWLASAWLIISSYSIQAQEIEIINGIEHIEISRDVGLIKQLSLIVVCAALMFYANFFNIKQLHLTSSRMVVFTRSLLILLLGFGSYIILHTLFLPSLAVYPLSSLSIGLFIFYFTVSTTYGLGHIWIKTEARNHTLALEKKKAELNLLRSQLHPHFLFNVLNNLLSMVDQARNPKLTASIDKLSSLLRYVVYENKGEKVNLNKEIEFLMDFAALNSLRFEENELDFKLDIQGNLECILIEPGMFIPFIENAFSYGIMPEKKSYIHVKFELEQKGQLVFKIENKLYPALQPKELGGTGISSVRNRLDLVYPNRYSLRIEENDYFILELSIDLNESDYCR